MVSCYAGYCLERSVEEAMRGTVKKWGNSAAVRIPYRVLEAVSLSLEDEVYIREDNGKIVIEPIQPTRYDLNDLLKRITAENQHQAVDFGHRRVKKFGSI